MRKLTDKIAKSKRLLKNKQNWYAIQEAIMRFVSPRNKFKQYSAERKELTRIETQKLNKKFEELNNPKDYILNPYETEEAKYDLIMNKYIKKQELSLDEIDFALENFALANQIHNNLQKMKAKKK